MKKLILTLLVLMPVVVTAAPVGVIGSWDPYSSPTATMHMKCGTNNATKTEIGSSLASTGTVTSTGTVEANPGDDVKCTFQATLGPDSSPESQEVSFHLPLSLPAPVGHVRVAP